MNAKEKLKTIDDLVELINDCGYEDIVIFNNPDYASAFVGVSDDNRAIYDYEKMIKHLIKEWNCDNMEAIEFIDYNSIRSLPYYENAPIIMYPLTI